jgi:hypothetical protein
MTPTERQVMNEFQDRWAEIVTLLGEVSVTTVAARARVLFAGIGSDPTQRAAFREHLLFMEKCLRQAPRTVFATPMLYGARCGRNWTRQMKTGR